MTLSNKPERQKLAILSAYFSESALAVDFYIFSDPVDRETRRSLRPLWTWSSSFSSWPELPGLAESVPSFPYVLSRIRCIDP